MASGIAQQHGTGALGGEPPDLAVANDLDSSANFDAICMEDAEGALLLRNHVTIRWGSLSRCENSDVFHTSTVGLCRRREARRCLEAGEICNAVRPCRVGWPRTRPPAA